MSHAPIEHVESDHRLRREFSLWSAFAFAFAFISPIVALYGIFGLAITTAGPSFWWNFLIVFGGQILVALVLAELVSRWPVEGSVYQWARRLLGDTTGWFGGWFYIWTLLVAMATVALAAAGFIGNIFDVVDMTPQTQVLIALVILLFGTVVNVVGRGVLKFLMGASIVAEIIGSVGLAAWLLIFHREQSLSVITDGLGDGMNSAYLAFSGPFLIAMAFVGWTFVGFESAGSIAEEVKSPRRNLPKAVLFSLTFIAVIVMFSSLAIILSIPNMDAVTSGEVADPVYDTLVYQLGEGIAKPVQILFVIGFLASFLALQTSASRLIWSYARDHALPASAFLGRLTTAQKLPANAIIVTALVGTAIFVVSQFAENFYAMMVNFTSGGFYIAFLFPVLGFLVVRLSGRWTPGPWSMGNWGKVVAVAASIWVVFQFLNIAWPRDFYTEQPWLNWSVWIAVIGLTVIGAVIYAAVRSKLTIVDVSEVVGSESEDPESASSDRG